MRPAMATLPPRPSTSLRSPAKLTVTTHPRSTAASGAAFAPQPVVHFAMPLKRQNAVSQARRQTYWRASPHRRRNPRSGVLPPWRRMPRRRGLHHLAITGVAGDRTLTFSSGVLTPWCRRSSNHGRYGQSAFPTHDPPAAIAASGSAFTQQPVIQLRTVRLTQWPSRSGRHRLGGERHGQLSAR